MRLVFENFEHVTDAYKDQYAEAVRRVSALVENVNDLENYKGDLGLVTKENIETIKVYGDDYADEFYIDLNTPVNPKGSVADGHEKYLYIEILTAESAESNEREYMSGNSSFTKEERENYKLGETVQWYKPLGESGYWYTLK